MKPEPQTARIQGDHRLGLPAGTIPWAVHLVAMREYNRHHSQTPERLAGRGGFDWVELIACLRGDYSAEGCRQAHDDLRAALDSTTES